MLFSKKLVHRFDLASEGENDDEDDRGEGEDAQRHFDVHGEEVDGHGGEEREALDDHADDPCDVVADGVEVAGQAGHEVAGSILVVEVHVLVLDLGEEVVADAVEGALRDVLVGHAVEVDDEGAQERDADHGVDEGVEAVFVAFIGGGGGVSGQEAVDDLLRKVRYGELHGVVQHRAEHRDDQQAAEPLDVVPYPLDFVAREALLVHALSFSFLFFHAQRGGASRWLAEPGLSATLQIIL